MKELKSCPIKKAYEKFKHLDALLSDEDWLIGDKEDGTALKHTLYHLWQAIKEYSTRIPPATAGMDEIELYKLLSDYAVLPTHAVNIPDQRRELAKFICSKSSPRLWMLGS